MRLKRSLLLIILALNILSCGLHAPFVDDCLIDQTTVKCSGKMGSPKNGIHDYSLTPLQADKYICQSTGDFLNSKLYILTLERNLAKCIKTVIPLPKVFDCAIDGQNQLVYCSDGIADKTLSWVEAYKYLCVSETDFTLLKIYRAELLNDIANCTPSKK